MKSLIPKILFTIAIMVFACSGLFCLPGFAAHIRADDILNAVEKKYTGKSFTADFSQVLTLAAMDTTQTASGRAWFNHPGKMKWLYLEPERHEIITNGTSIWIFRPDINQVMTGDADNFFKPGAGGNFLSDIGLIRKNYTITIDKTNDAWVELLLVPKAMNPDISSIVIRVCRTNNEIQRITTYNVYNDPTMFKFSNIEFKTVDDSLFDFKIPDGTSIIEMD